MLLSPTHPDREGLARTVADLGGTVIAVRAVYRGTAVDSWIVLWRREDRDYATHRVYPVNPVALHHGHYDLLDADEVIADLNERLGRPMTVEIESQIRHALAGSV